MNKIIKYLIKAITKQERLLKAIVSLKTKVELLEMEVSALKQTIAIMDNSRVQDNLKINQYTKAIAETLQIIQNWVNEHTRQSWKN